jgi:hypothetical protein
MKKREEELMAIKEKALKLQGGEVLMANGEIGFYEVRSLWCFHYTNCLRRKIIWLVTWKWFDHFITTVILVNSIMLGLKDYRGRLEGESYVSVHN